MAITDGYATLTQVKAALRIPESDNVDNTLLEMAIESASRLIDGHTSRRFFLGDTSVKLFVPTDDFVVEVDDLSSDDIILQSSSAADGVFDITWTDEDYQLEPLNGELDGIPWCFTKIRAVGDFLWPISGLEATVKVTGIFGFPYLPLPVTQACVIQSSRIFKRLDSPLGVAGFGDMGAMRVSRDIDPDVAQLLMPYRRMRNFA